jgi:hypothetical protein
LHSTLGYTPDSTTITELTSKIFFNIENVDSKNKADRISSIVEKVEKKYICL